MDARGSRSRCWHPAPARRRSPSTIVRTTRPSASTLGCSIRDAIESSERANLQTSQRSDESTGGYRHRSGRQDPASRAVHRRTCWNVGTTSSDGRTTPAAATSTSKAPLRGGPDYRGRPRDHRPGGHPLRRRYLDFEALDRVFHVENNAGAVTFNRLRITVAFTGDRDTPVQAFLSSEGEAYSPRQPLTSTDSEIVGNIAPGVQRQLLCLIWAEASMVRGRLSTPDDDRQHRRRQHRPSPRTTQAATCQHGVGDRRIPGDQRPTLPPLGVDITNSTISGNEAEGDWGDEDPRGPRGQPIRRATAPSPGNNATPVNLTNVTITEQPGDILGYLD